MKLLKPVEAYECDFHKKLVPKSECEGCEYLEEIRSPWYRWGVKCNFEGVNE